MEEQVEFAKEVVKSNGFDMNERKEGMPNRFEWSETEFNIVKQDDSGHFIRGTVSVFQHGSRVYQVIVQYPEEYEEGFVPRVVKMFEDLEWYKTS